MAWNMVNFDEIQALSPSRQFLQFSDAYVDSAELLCSIIAAETSNSSYPKGAVIMSLAFHGIELFLKAAILEESPGERFKGRAGHDLEQLGAKYKELYPNEEYRFEVPFRNEEASLLDPDPQVLEELKRCIKEHNKTTPEDQLHRYPQDMNGNPWRGLYAFEAQLFLGTIAQVRKDIARLKKLIFSG